MLNVSVRVLPAFFFSNMLLSMAPPPPPPPQFFFHPREKFLQLHNLTFRRYFRHLAFHLP